MNHYDQILKAYSDAGLKTMEDWVSVGREIRKDSEPRTQTTHRGAAVLLYSRNQTEMRKRQN